MPRNIDDMARRRLAGTLVRDLFGFEVEAEGMTAEYASDPSNVEWSDSFGTNWRIIHDGSLRNGLEFISIPLTRGSVPEAVRGLWEEAFASGRVAGSTRTGIHIHCSMLGRTTADALRLAQHYALVEPVLFGMLGAEREQNIYCIPWYRAHDEPQRIWRWLADDGEAVDRSAELLRNWDLEPPTCKYSALNFSPLTRYGTVEFRHAPTYATVDQVLEWWDVVAAVYATAETEYNVLQVYRELGPEEFARRVFRNLPIQIPPSRVFEELEVERVAEFFGDIVAVRSTEWGRAPELRIELTEDARRRIAVEEAAENTIQAALRRVNTLDAMRRPRRGIMLEEAAPPDEDEEQEPYPDEDAEEEWGDGRPEPDEEEFEPGPPQAAAPVERPARGFNVARAR